VAEASSFEIIPLEGNEPLAHIEMGTAKVIQTYQNYIHIVRLQEYKAILDGIE